MSDAIITVSSLGKKYRIRHQGNRQRYTALRDVLAQKLSAPFQFLRQTARPPAASHGPLSRGPVVSSPSSEDFWALKQVSFEVQRGEVVGIIGRNGAGKSTLLKVLSRITEPTEGRVHLRGRVASLLEVGTGFHPELTGRENIFLNGAILGMNRAEIRRKFDEIVVFAEVERFLDTPVKHYSSGMYVRLAFAVAAHLEPEILIVDEVLAVGDAAFQKKCLGKMNDVATHGRTVLFVSHNMAVVAQLCQRAILLESGAIVANGATEQTIRGYLGKEGASPVCVRVDPSQHSDAWGGSSKIQLLAVRLVNAHYQSFTVHWKEPIQFELEFSVKEPSRNLYFGLAITTNQGGDLLGSHHDDDGTPLYAFEPGVYRLMVTLENPFRAGLYYLSIGASAAIGGSAIFRVANAVCLEVLDISLAGGLYPQYHGGPINGLARWSAPALHRLADSPGTGFARPDDPSRPIHPALPPTP
jgi:lipopolysaccharide transport system ATP-binding protein